MKYKMRGLLTAVILSFSLMTTGCNITKLITQDPPINEQVSEDESKTESSSVFKENNTSEKGAVEFKELIKTNPDTKYEIAQKDGYYLIGPLDGHLINVSWYSADSFNFRLDNGKTAIISKGKIDKNGVSINAVIEAPAEGLYINKMLGDEKGLIFISLMDEKNFYWYKNNELKEYKNIQYYLLSPLQKYIILFSGDYKTRPVLLELTTGKEVNLPLEADHGWPAYGLGLSFSSDEAKLIYEDWSKMELCIYDIKGQKESLRINEKGYSLIEGALSPNGKLAAYLKYDNTKEPINLMENRIPFGHKLVVYDLEKKKALKEVPGESLVYQKSIWSPDSKNLVLNMVEIQNEKKPEEKMIGIPYLLNIGTGKAAKLSEIEEGLKYAVAWSEDNKKVMVGTKHQGTSNQFSAIDIKLKDEFDIDINKYYTSMLKKLGTDIYEIVSIDNSQIGIFERKYCNALSADDEYLAFGTAVEGKEYLIIASRQKVN